MYFLVFLVVDDTRQCTSVIDAWEAAGVTGITILESTGLGRLRYKSGLRDDIPLMPSLRSITQSREEHHRTLMSIVQGEEMVDKLVEATEEAIGPLDEPNKGVLFALPVAKVVGLPSDEEIRKRRSGD